MARTLKGTGGSFVLSAVWCSFVLTIILMDAVHASRYNSSSSSTVTSDELSGDNSETTMEKGMRPFFDMVKTFLGIVQPHKLTEQSWLNVSDVYRNGEFHLAQFEDWQNWTKYLIGFVVCAAVGVVFCLAVPITGLVFCCCRCAGKCGGRTKPHDPKHAGCKRNSYCTVLLLLNTVTLAGVVCAFLSNEIVYQKVRNEDNAGLVGQLTDSLNQMDRFADSTTHEVERSILTRFQEAKVLIISDVRNTANDAVEDVLGNLNATFLIDQTRNLSKVVNRTRDELSNMATQLDTLSRLGTWLANNLTQIAVDVDTVCASSNTQCGNYDGNKYQVVANFSGLSDLSSEAQKIANSVNLGQYIREAEETIDRTKNITTQSVDDGINKATDSVNTVEMNIRGGIADLRSEVKKNVLNRTASARAELHASQPDITQYGKYVWYGGLGVSCVLLLLVVFYYVGVLFGLCGERPGVGAQCCNTGTGANFLMAGVGFTFMLAWLVMLVCVLLFLAGGPVHTELCRYFIQHEPQELKPFNDAVMQAVDLRNTFFEGKDINLDLIDVLEGCKSDQPVYSVLKLENLVNLTDLTSLQPLRTELNRLKTASFNIPDITIVTAQLNETVNDFATSGLESVNFAQYYAEVNKNLTVGDLHVLASNLRSIGYQSSADAQFRSVMLGKADDLDRLAATLVVEMKAAVTSMKTSLNYLQTQARAQIKPATDALLSGLQTAQNDFNAEKTRLVTTQLDVVIDRVLGLAHGVIQEMLRDVDENIGRCRPLFESIFSASDAVCVSVLEPLNGFWFSIGWCLFLSIPCLIFAVKLAGLYRREHDEKDFDDPHYILYGGNQDTIPLTSVDEGQPTAYPGAANAAYHGEGYLGPRDRYAPPPYAAHYSGMGSGEMAPPPYGRPGHLEPRGPHLARHYPYPSDPGVAPYDAY